MRASDIAESVKLCIAAKQPVMITGQSGVGKSDLGQQIAADTDRIPIDIRAMLYDLVDLRGLPSVMNKRTGWNPSGMFPLKGYPGDDKRYLVTLEELNRAPQSILNGFLQLVLDRAIGEFKLADDVAIISCCNPAGSRGVTELSEAMRTRFLHLTMTADLNDWCKWAASNGIEPELIAFMRLRDEMLHIPGKLTCPRQWASVSRLQKLKPPAHLEYELYAGLVDEGPAIEYMAFLKFFRGLSGLIDSIMLNPGTADVPSDPATLYAISSALARRASVKTIDRIVQYSKRMPDEYAVYCIKDAARRDKTLTATPAFTTWAIANNDAMNN